MQELHQGDRQGPEESDVQDGHLDLHVVHRARRSSRRWALARRWSKSISPARPPTSRASACSRSPKRRSASTARRSARRRRARRRRSMPAASTPGACAARNTCGRPTRSRSCSSRRAPSYATYKEYAQLINDQSRRHMTFRGLFEFRFDALQAGADRGGRAGGRDREALLDRRDVARLDLDRSAHDARRRDEPHRRQDRTPAKAARTAAATRR